MDESNINNKSSLILNLAIHLPRIYHIQTVHQAIYSQCLSDSAVEIQLHSTQMPVQTDCWQSSAATNIKT